MGSILKHLSAVSLAGILLPASVSFAADGEQLYQQMCAACHQPDGSGVPTLAPPLLGPLWSKLGIRSPKYIAHTMISGMAGQNIDGETYYAAMPSWASLGDTEIAAIGNYVLESMNGSAHRLTPEMVANWRGHPIEGAALKELRNGVSP